MYDIVKYNKTDKCFHGINAVGAFVSLQMIIMKPH